MKKLLFAMIIIAGLFGLTSCQKDVIIVPPGVEDYDPAFKEGTYKFTDAPPKEIWDRRNTNYLETEDGYVSEHILKEIQKISKPEWGCRGYVDQNGDWISHDCAEYYTVPIRKYWGMHEGVMYFSKGIYKMTARENLVAKFSGFFLGTGKGIAFVRFSQRHNSYTPLNNQYEIWEVK